MNVRIFLPFFALYFAQGYPLGFLAVLLPLSGERAGFSSTAIGIGMTCAMTPTLLKPLLAPKVDLAKSRRRRLLKVQSVMVIAAGVLFVFCASLSLDWVAAFAGTILYGGLTAYQDVTTDGLAIETLANRTTGTANAAMGLGMVSGSALGNSLAIHISSEYSVGLSFLSVTCPPETSPGAI